MNSDILIGSWLNELGGSSNLYQSIDESTINDLDYIVSDVEAIDNIVEFTLSSIDDPNTSGSHILSYRYMGSSSGNGQLEVELLDGVTSIALWTHDISDTSWHTVNQTLSSAEADSIGDYTNLRLKFTARA